MRVDRSKQELRLPVRMVRWLPGDTRPRHRDDMPVRLGRGGRRSRSRDHNRTGCCAAPVGATAIIGWFPACVMSIQQKLNFMLKSSAEPGPGARR